MGEGQFEILRAKLICVLVMQLLWYIEIILLAGIIPVSLFFLFDERLELNIFSEMVKEFLGVVGRVAGGAVSVFFLLWLLMKKMLKDLRNMSECLLEIPPDIPVSAITVIFYYASPLNFGEFIWSLIEVEYSTWKQRGYGEGRITVLTYYYLLRHWTFSWASFKCSHLFRAAIKTVWS